MQSPWWRHQMKTFSALVAICAGNSPVFGEFPAQRPVTRSFDVFFDMLPNKRLSKQWWSWWFETPSCSLWRHCNVISQSYIAHTRINCIYPCLKLLLNLMVNAMLGTWITYHLQCSVNNGVCVPIDQFHKTHNALVPYHTIRHSGQECVHLCSGWFIVGYGTGVLWDLRYIMKRLEYLHIYVCK